LPLSLIIAQFSQILNTNQTKFAISYIYNITINGAYDNIIFYYFIFRHDYHNEPFNEFHHNMLHVNNGNVPYVNDPRLGNLRGVAHANENFQLHRPNNRIAYNDELDEIVDEDEGHDMVQIHHHNPNHNIDEDEEDDYPDEPIPPINHHRHDNYFNHRL